MVSSDPQIAPVTAEWAMWGRAAASGAYGLQASSAGALTGALFQQVLRRYSPGTLKFLPQVTIGWLQPGEGSRGADAEKAGRDFIALIINDEQEALAADGQVVLTRIFCVPYEQLAAGTVSYRAMYQEFDRVRPPMPDRGLISVTLPAAARSAASADALALRVAALLLTTKPVCVLGADRVDLNERLRFIDAVASLLPYGLRSRLSASTWASSTFRDHRFRLFFASADRNAADPDHVVRWGHLDDTPVGHPDADGYLQLMAGDGLRLAKLAEYTERISFTPGDIGKMLGRLGAAFGPSSPRLDADTSAERAMPGERIAPADGVGIRELLESCARSLEGNQTGLHIDTERLRRVADQPVTGQQRRRIAELVEDLHLLRPDVPVTEGPLMSFYAALLPLALATPLDYQAYCRIENWTGKPAARTLHRPLLLAMRQVGLKDEARLLAAMAISDEELMRALSESSMSLADLVSLVAGPNLRPHHVKLTCGAILRAMLDGSGETGWQELRQELRAALREQGYLALTLAERFPGESDYQFDLLCELLRSAYGRTLSRADAQDVLDAARDRLSVALVAAILRLVPQRDAPWVASLFTIGVIAAAGLSGKRVGELARLLRVAPVAASPSHQPAREGRRFARRPNL